MRTISWIAMVAGVLVIAVVGAGQLGLLAGSEPADLGVANGRLNPPSTNPNSVSSQTRLYPGHPQQAYADIEPLKFTGDGQAAMERLASVLKESPGTVIVKQQPGYLYAQSRSRVLKFTDDVELWMDKEASVIHFRSASRLGRKDFGVNRARMEAIRARFEG